MGKTQQQNGKGQGHKSREEDRVHSYVGNQPMIREIVAKCAVIRIEKCGWSHLDRNVGGNQQA